MISFLTGLPLWLSGMLIVGLPTVLAMFGPTVVRRYLTLEKLAENNEVAGFKFAVVGVLYAVLLGFAIIVVWQRFSDAENNVATEASETWKCSDINTEWEENYGDDKTHRAQDGTHCPQDGT